ncbi:hypothetical protein LCGC14_0692960 [marine sediment metagenome]|uniref:Uncharacterized protein n=1 Tax=marine sediment metagenome TaxID=412755 RepID=A0A0F9QPU3_9ZZZZ
MPTNRIIVEYEQGVAKLTVWDGAGTLIDCSSIFEEVRDLTAQGRASSSLSLKADSLQTNMKFDAVKKELVYDVAPDVVSQILQMVP